MVGWGSGIVIGISVVVVGGILNMGILGMFGNLDMCYIGVVCMCGMFYRLVCVIIDCGCLLYFNVFF